MGEGEGVEKFFRGFRCGGVNFFFEVSNVGAFLKSKGENFSWPMK